MEHNHLTTPDAKLPPPLPVDNKKGGPWGFWATTGWGLLIAVVALCVQIMVGTVASIVGAFHLSEQSAQADDFLDSLATNGMFLGIVSLITIPFVVLGCLAFAKLRGTISVRDYLALRPLTWKEWLIWPVITMICVFVLGWGLDWLGAPEVDPWVLEMWTSTDQIWIIIIAVVIGAPLMEEILFRGFLFRGWQESRLGLIGTILLTNILWWALHIAQYNWYALSFVFILGLGIGLARWYSNSLYVPMLIHFVNNAYSCISISLYVANNPAL